MRPLFLWIAGILLYTHGLSPGIALAALLLPAAWLVAGWMVAPAGRLLRLPPQKGKIPLYARRWVWGSLFAPLLVSLAMLATAIRTEWPVGTRPALFFSGNSSRPVFVFPARSALFPPSAPSGNKSLAPAPLRTLPFPSTPSGPVLPFSEEALHLQIALAERYARLRLSDEEKSVLATLTLGYRPAMPRSVRDRFSAAGVSHILAVSGFHVAVVAGFASFFLGWLPRRGKTKSLRWLLTLGAVWGYVWLTGGAPSALRAGAMITLFLTGRLLRRRTDRYNTWAAAAFCMLAYNPLYLFNIGFQLSYAAVFAILYFQPRIRKQLPVRNPLLAYPWEGLAVTMAAQLGTLFLCLYYFGRFPLFFLFTNLPVTVLATLLIPLGLLWVGLPAACPGYGWLQTVVEALTGWLVGVVDGFGRIPGAAYPLSLDGFSLFCLYGALFFASTYARGRRRWPLLAALSFLLIMLIRRLIERFLLSGC